MNELSLPGVIAPAPFLAALTNNEPPMRRVIGRWNPVPIADTVVTAEVYRKDVVFKVRADVRRPPQRISKRGVIKGFSPASRKRLQLLVRNTADMWGGFVTLTYPLEDAPRDGVTCKRHIHAFCAWLRRNEVAYVWILEFQRNGSAHYHFLVRGWVPRDVWTKDGHRVKIGTPGAKLETRGLESAWYDIVGTGREKHRLAGTRVEAIKNPDQVGIYMSKYVSKLVDKDGFQTKAVPKGFERVGRYWGSSKCLTKVLFRMRGLYRDVAEKSLGEFAAKNGEIRQGWADRMQQEAEAQTDHNKRADLEARSMSYAEPWEWNGYGFMMIGGAKAFQAALRAAVIEDGGSSPWKEWDGVTPDARPPFISEKDRLDAQGQMLLAGGFEPLYPRYDE